MTEGIEQKATKATKGFVCHKPAGGRSRRCTVGSFQPEGRGTLTGAAEGAEDSAFLDDQLEAEASVLSGGNLLGATRFTRREL